MDLFVWTPSWVLPGATPHLGFTRAPATGFGWRKVAGDAKSLLSVQSNQTDPGTNRMRFDAGTDCATVGTAKWQYKFPKVASGILVFGVNAEWRAYPSVAGGRQVRTHRIRFLDTTGAAEAARAEFGIEGQSGVSSSSSSSPASSSQSSSSGEILRWRLSVLPSIGATQTKAHDARLVAAGNGLLQAQHIVILNLDTAVATVLSGGLRAGTATEQARYDNEFDGQNLVPIWTAGDEDPLTGQIADLRGGIDTLEIALEHDTEGPGARLDLDGPYQFMALTHDPWFCVGDELAGLLSIGLWRGKTGVTTMPVSVYQRRLRTPMAGAPQYYEPALAEPNNPLSGIIEAGGRDILLSIGSHDIGQAGFTADCLNVRYTGTEGPATMEVTATGVTVVIGSTTTTLTFASYATLNTMALAISAIADVAATFVADDINRSLPSTRLMSTDGVAYDIIAAYEIAVDVGASSSSSSSSSSSAFSSSSSGSGDGYTFEWHDARPFADMQSQYLGIVHRALAMDCNLILSTLMPRGDDTYTAEARETIGRADVLEFNLFIKALGQQYGLVVMDAYDLLGDADGHFTEGLTDDGISPNLDGIALCVADVKAAMTSGAVRYNTIQQMAAAALVDINLDHLMKVPPTTLADAVVDQTALAELLAVGGDASRFTSNTDSLEAIRNKLDTLGAAGAAVSGAAAYAGEGFITRTIGLVRKVCDEPSVDAKWNDAEILDRIHKAFAQVIQDVNAASQAQILIRHDIALVVNQLIYPLPPHVGNIREFAVIDSVTDAVTAEIVPRSFYNPAGAGFRVEGHYLRLGRKPTKAQTLRLTYTPTGEFRMVKGTWTDALSSGKVTASTLILSDAAGTQIGQGSLDTRDNAYAGCMLRILADAGGYVQDRLITAYNNRTRMATVAPPFSPTPATDASNSLEYEVIPIMGDLLEEVVVLRAALMIVAFEGNKKKVDAITREYSQALRAIRMDLANRQTRMGMHWEHDTRDNPATYDQEAW